MVFVKIAVVTACGILANAGLGSARSINEFTSQGQNAKGRNLLAHIEQEELRHLGRGLRADGDTYSYGEYDGYRSWGGICQQGDKIPQSPIDIPDDKVREANSKPTSAMHFNYSKLVGATAVNTGHGVQVNMPKDNILTIGDQKWQLLQYHFHSPSEHALRGRQASMEIHLVHSNVDSGDLAVIGVLLDASVQPGVPGFSSALKQGLDNVPKTIKEESGPFNLNVDTFTSLLNPTNALPSEAVTGGGSVPVITYSGSLTTPPCTAGVQWYVVMKSSSVGVDQVYTFQRFLGNDTTLSQNARPVQPGLGRDLSVNIGHPAAGSATPASA